MIGPRDDLALDEGYHSPQVDVAVRLNTNEAPEAPPAGFVESLHDELDRVLEAYVELDRSRAAILKILLSEAGSEVDKDRLVEAGVRCVTIDHTNWDTHDNNFSTLKNDLLPILDPGLTMLLRDLTDRGRLDKTLVIVTGEFGRTPRINQNAGRDHWGPATTVLLAGGGVQGGRVIGATDARAEKPLGTPYGPEDLASTLFRLIGIDAAEEFLTPEGRPVKIANNGRVMQELL